MIYCEKQHKLVEAEGFCLLCDCKHTKEKTSFQAQQEEIAILKAQNRMLQRGVNEQIADAIEEIAGSLVGRIGDLLRSKAYEWRVKK